MNNLESNVHDSYSSGVDFSCLDNLNGAYLKPYEENGVNCRGLREDLEEICSDLVSKEYNSGDIIVFTNGKGFLSISSSENHDGPIYDLFFFEKKDPEQASKKDYKIKYRGAEKEDYKIFFEALCNHSRHKITILTSGQKITEEIIDALLLSGKYKGSLNEPNFIFDKYREVPHIKLGYLGRTLDILTSSK